MGATSPDLGKNLLECMEDYGVGGDSPWSNNLLSSQAVRGPSGKVGLPGEVDAMPHAEELALCERLSAEAAAQVPDMSVGMGSEGDTTFEPFFVARHSGWTCDVISTELVRSIFGGALYPDAIVRVESLSESASWWERVDESAREEWQPLIAWFQAQNFLETAFVVVGDYDDDHIGTEGGCVYLRLVLGRTPGGSLVGVVGNVVYS